MELRVIVEGQTHTVVVPDSIVEQARDFFDKMDRDMDGGWQMSHTWVESPTAADRCRIAADRLSSAMHMDNRKMAVMMGGYILSRQPRAGMIEMDMEGDMSAIRIMDSQGNDLTDGYGAPAPVVMSREQAMAQADQEVSKVYKAGRQHRFSVFNRATGDWDECTVGNEQEAEQMRQAAWEQRARELCGDA